MAYVAHWGSRVSRREVIGLAAGAVAGSLPARAAVAAPRIGLLATGAPDGNRAIVDALVAGLAAAGWHDGANCAIDERWAQDRSDRLPALARELVASGVNVLVTAGTLATAAALGATTTIPIVLVGVGDPVAIGAVDSLERPGGNATGLTLSSRETAAKRVQLLKELVPGLKRLAVIIRHDPGLEQTVAEIRAAAEAADVRVVAFEAPTGRTIEFAFTYLRNDRCDALYVASGPLGPAKRGEIISLARDGRLPTMYAYRAFVFDGGLVSFAINDGDLFRRAGAFVDRILRGINPADLPVEPPAKFELTINLTAAQGLGLAVPPALLARADKVIG